MKRAPKPTRQYGPAGADRRKSGAGAAGILTLLSGILLLASCDVKDPIYNTPHPDSGKITLTTDWSGIGEGLTAPANYTVVAGDYTATLSGTTNVLDHLFAPGKYGIYVYNPAEHVSVSGTTATVAQQSMVTPTDRSGSASRADGAGPFIHSAPGWLFTSVTEVQINKDTDHAFTAVMQQQVRGLTLIIEPTGGTTDKIESITGTLSGVASTLDFANDTHGAPANAALTFSKITSGADAGRWGATVRLLGVAGAQQKLNAQIHFTGGSPKAVDLKSDLTAVLASFNADKRTPLTLGGRVVETPTGAGFEATITDWESVEGGEVTAD